MKVVTLIDFLSRDGGAERLALSVATRLNPELFESTLCVSRWPDPGAASAGARLALEELSATGVKLLGLGRQGKVDVWVWGKLVSFLHRERTHVLHAHKFGSNAWGTIAGRLAGVPVVLAHEHTWSYEGQLLRRLVDRELIARGATRLIAVSREDQRRMAEIEGIDPRRTVFIPNGILSSPPSEARDVRATLEIEPDAQVIGVVGVLRPQKAIHVLLRATPLLRGEWPRLRVVVVGDGPERAALEGLARELGVDETVRFLGRRADVPELLQALDIGVCCSDFEGSPLAIMEYMRAELPVVATAVGGVPDLIETGVHGLLVPSRNPNALAEAVSELLRDPQRARAMGRRGHERQHAEFDVEVMVKRLEALYYELLDEQEQSDRRA